MHRLWNLDYKTVKEVCYYVKFIVLRAEQSFLKLFHKVLPEVQHSEE